MSVGEIVAAVAVGQSTVSAHLKVLAEVRFVLAEQRGTGGEPVDTPADTQLDGCGSTAYGLSAAELGVPAGALRASMACGNPVEVADVQPGDVVLDLGSGGGLDVLLSARRVGPDGHVYGIDASPDMIELAREHAVEAGVGNVEFRLGYLEDIPLPDAAVDVACDPHDQQQAWRGTPLALVGEPQSQLPVSPAGLMLVASGASALTV